MHPERKGLLILIEYQIVELVNLFYKEYKIHKSLSSEKYQSLKKIGKYLVIRKTV